MRVLIWNVHGGWMNAFVRGHHDYVLPVDPAGVGGRGWYPWPATVTDAPIDSLREAELDVAVVQSVAQLGELERITGRSPGGDLPTVYVEHNTPRGHAAMTAH